jgi:histidyl-tRNA synthetase
MAQKPSLPKGTRDFGPQQMLRRNYILDSIRSVFKKYGFMPLETPAMENLSTLTGKYGDEGDQLLFRILNSGDYIKKLDDNIPDFYHSINYLTAILNKFVIEFSKTSFANNAINKVSGDEYISFDKNSVNLFIKTRTDIAWVDSIDTARIKRTWQFEKFLDDNLESICYEIYYIFNKHSTQLKDVDRRFKQYMRVDFSTSFLPKLFKSIYGSSKEVRQIISEKGLKYDLTVPFARYVVSNQNDITFPFKRYQIQPVWRADRPQKGRYREFYQCDVDVIGTKSLICEAELMCIVHEVFDSLQFNDYSVSISSRKILEGIAKVLGINDQFSQFVIILDKLDKIGEDKVAEELKRLNVESDALEKLKLLLNLRGSNEDKLAELKSHFTDSQIGLEGINDLKEVLQHCKDLGRENNNLEFDISLARGLSYYTGVIYEVKPTSISMGSISGGGRYDNLTGNFGLLDVSGVGISFGVDRIYDTLNELGLFPTDNLETTSVLITNFDEQAQKEGLKMLSSLRNSGIKSEIYPDQAKLKKQMNYADKKAIPYVILVGSEEIASGKYTLKNMKDGLQQQLSLDKIIDLLK